MGTPSSMEVPNLQMPPYNAGMTAAGTAAGFVLPPPTAMVGGALAAGSMATLSKGPGRVPRCCFGDSEHHVDAPKSPIRGHAPLHPPHRARQPLQTQRQRC